MSQYIEFYLRTDEGEYYPIGSYGRSTAVFQAFQYVGVPYEKITPLTKNLIDDAIHNLDVDIAKYKKALDKSKLEYEAVKSFNNSVEEKREGLECLASYQDELVEEIACSETAKSFICFLDDIADLNKYHVYEQDEDVPEDVQFVYVGYEVGLPTDDMILGG